jgi:hypothetical protein
VTLTADSLGWQGDVALTAAKPAEHPQVSWYLFSRTDTMIERTQLIEHPPAKASQVLTDPALSPK